MSMYNEPEFQKQVQKAKSYHIRSIIRCVYSWVLVLGPMLLLEKAAETLNRWQLWCYVIGGFICLVLGIVLWIKGWAGAVAPIHKPAVRCYKHFSEENLRALCAALVSIRKGCVKPKEDFDLLRRMQTMSATQKDVIPRELAEFYTKILQGHKIAGA